MFQSILVAINYDDTSDTILDEAIVLAKRLDARLMLVHVLSSELAQPTLVAYSYPVITEEIMQQFRAQWEVLEKEGLARLQSLTSKATAAGVPTEFTQNVGDPGHVICALAKNWNADLIVMGRRERSALGELVMGSVSQFVMHHAHCSVLLIQDANAPSAPSGTAG